MGRVPLDHHRGSETQGRGAPVLGAGLAQASPRLCSGGQGWGRLDVGPASTQDPLEVRATRVHWQPAKAGAPSRKCSASSLAAGGPGDQGRGEPACGDLRPSRTWGLPGTGPGRARPAPRGLGPGGTRGPLWAGACPPPRRPGAPSRPGRKIVSPGFGNLKLSKGNSLTSVLCGSLWRPLWDLMGYSPPGSSVHGDSPD